MTLLKHWSHASWEHITKCFCLKCSSRAVSSCWDWPTLWDGQACAQQPAPGCFHLTVRRHHWACPASAHSESWCVPGHEKHYHDLRLGSDRGPSLDLCCVWGELLAWPWTLPLDVGTLWQSLSTVSCCTQCQSGTQLLMKDWDLLGDRLWSESPCYQLDKYSCSSGRCCIIK